jgi:3-oxoacyl-[acyl-carrier protein] reductase
MDQPVTLITGTRTGIGRALAEHYVQRGHEVAGLSRKPPDWELPSYTHFLADVTDERAVRDAVARIRQRFGRLDHLVNNAGVASMNHFLLVPLATARSILDVNVTGTFLVSREAVKVMKTRGYGRIVNLTSVAVPLKVAGESVYAASKAAVLSLTQIMAREVAEFGITVNALGPGPTETALIRNVPKEKIQALLGLQAIPRLASFDDIANVVDFFLEPRSSFVTGQCIYLGGV